MHIETILLTTLSFFAITHGQYRYIIEYAEETIYTKCDDYPDNFIDLAFDRTNLNYRLSDGGFLLVNGNITLLKTITDNTPVSTSEKGMRLSFYNRVLLNPSLIPSKIPMAKAKVETFKKARGNWQPTLYTFHREDVCKTSFDSSEMWYQIFENTPKEQQICPFTKGQIIDVNVSADSSINVAMRGVEGEYLVRIEIGDKSDDIFMCIQIEAQVHKA